MTVLTELLFEMRSYLEGFGVPVSSFLGRMSWQMRERELEARTLAVAGYLQACTERASGRGRQLAGGLTDKASCLRWGQTYAVDDFGQKFLDNYGWIELFGTRGHFVNETMAGGFLLLGPDTTYPDHRHVAEEIYIPLTGGTVWRKGDEAFSIRAADDVIHHASNVSHAMRTESEPLLALYLWRGGPLDQKSTIVG